jgi:ferric-dicitrate binding protein FerR (iron transport regulator)
MPDDYLWDRSGEPDAEVEHLERVLSRLREDLPVPAFPALEKEPRPGRRRFLLPSLAAAAVVLLACGLWLSSRYFQVSGGWEVVQFEGTPRAGDRAVSNKTRLPVGQWLETDAASSAVLKVDNFGSVEVEPNTRLRLLKANASEEHLALERGTIHAQIAAPPYVFLVYTPSAYALDMGCAYTLHVDDDGAGILRVTFGWVQLEKGERQAMVPAGAAAETRPGTGPGAPYYEDASEAFRKALQTVNFDVNGPQGRSAALTVLLLEARPRDGFTLLNLFRRVEPADRGRLYDRLAQLLPPPAGITREDVVNGNWRSLDLWWNELGFGQIKKGTKRPPHVEY